MHEDPKASALARTTRTRTNAAFAFASVVLVAACFLFLYYVCSTLWSLALVELLLYLFALLWNNAHVAMVLHSTYYALLASCFTPLLVFLVYLAYQTTVGTILKCKK